MLVGELAGQDQGPAAALHRARPGPFLQITNIGSAGVQQGIYDIALDPDFASNRFYYVFYTLGSPNHDRVSRFTANAALTGTVPGSEFVLYEDPQNANAEHHGGSLNFDNDGKLLFTTGEHFDPSLSQDLTSPRGKVHRINPDGTVPTDNPFYDGAGPEHRLDLGPRAAQPVPRLLRRARPAATTSPTSAATIPRPPRRRSTSAQRAPTTAGPTARATARRPAQSPLFSYPHNGRDASITGGFVYHGTQFPSQLSTAPTSTPTTPRTGSGGCGSMPTAPSPATFNFEPADGSVDGPYGDIVYLAEGPDGALVLRRPRLLRRRRHVRRQQDPADQLHPARTRPRWCTRRRTRPPGRRRSTVTSRAPARPTRGPAAHLLVELRRRHHLHRRQPDAHLRAPGAVPGPADRLRRRQQLDLHADRDQRGQRAHRDDPSPDRRDRSSRPGDLISFSGDGTDPDDGSLPEQRLHLEHRLSPRRPRPSRGPRSRASAAAASRSRPRATTSAEHPLPDHAHGQDSDGLTSTQLGDRPPATRST